MESARLPSGSRVGCAEDTCSPPELRDAGSKAHRGDDLRLSCPSEPRPESPSQNPSLQGFRPSLHRVRQNRFPGTGAAAMTHLGCPGLSQTLHAPPRAAEVDASVRGRRPEQRALETLFAIAHVGHTHPDSSSKLNRVRCTASKQLPQRTDSPPHSSLPTCRTFPGGTSGVSLHLAAGEEGKPSAGSGAGPAPPHQALSLRSPPARSRHPSVAGVSLQS